jgi:hypothetical protein
MDNKPPLPKKLASKVRVAQKTVNSTTQHYLHREKKIPELQAELAAWEADRQAWAEKHYPELGGPDSYPVQWRVKNITEKLEGYLREQTSLIEEAEAARVRLSHVEDEVFALLASMRPSTGRVPWPNIATSVEAIRIEMDLEAKKTASDIALYEAKRREEDRLWEKERSCEQAEQEREERREKLREIKEMVAKGPAHVLYDTIYRRLVSEAFKAFTDAARKDPSSPSFLAGGMVRFLESPAVKAAEAEARMQATAIIGSASAEGRALWDICRAHGCYTPETLPRE